MAHSSNEYQRNYLQMWRSRRKAKHTLQSNWEKDFEARFLTPELMTIMFASLYKVGQKIRDIDNLDEVNRIYQDLWKELEISEAKLKEL